MELSRLFWRNYDAVVKKPRYIVNEGGTRSGKTFSILQLLITLILYDKRPTITSVVSETFPHLRRGAIRDFETILGTNLRSDAHWNASDCIYTFDNGSKLEFFSADSPQKVHGPARDRLFLNEAINIDYETARQLFVRTRGIIIVDFNPTHPFWVHQHIVPRENCIAIHSTYRDNDFLTPEQVAEIESNKSDAAWWRVYGEGLVGVQEGVIYDIEQVDEMPAVGDLVETYGLDFGFTNDPSVLVYCLFDQRTREVWLDEVFWSTGMLNADMAEAMREAGISRTTPIFADDARPEIIADLCESGFNVLPCYKGKRKTEQIQTLRGWTIRVTKRSVNLIKEFRGYLWAKDRDGKALNEPISINDHGMDAWRYGVYTWLHEGGSGEYYFDFR